MSTEEPARALAEDETRRRLRASNRSLRGFLIGTPASLLFTSYNTRVAQESPAVCGLFLHGRLVYYFRFGPAFADDDIFSGGWPLDLWYTERQTDAVGLAIRVRRTLAVEKTPFQHLVVMETEQFGRMMVLDGMVQAAVADEFVYHEMITHVALHTHPFPRAVAVIGGGDGGAIREVLKHSSVERAVLVEIDEQVIQAAREYLPEIAGSLDDPRVEICVEDGLRHVREHKGEYDVILVDSTEPVGAAVGLFSAEFYADCYQSLTDDGIVVAQTESPFYNRDLIRRSFSAVARLFPTARLYLASIPTYPSGLWSFTLGSKEHDPLAVAADRFSEIATRYYTPDVHRAAFCLPRFVQELVS